MGQYLVIGIATAIGVSKEKAMSDFKGIENFKAVVEKEFNPSGIYQFVETEDFVQLELRPEIAANEWVDFIRSFFKLRYTGASWDYYEMEEILEELKEDHDLDSWLKLAVKKCHQCYQMEEFYFYPIDNQYSFYGWSNVRMEMVALSLDGKILMECYDNLFKFLLQLIQEKLSRFRLADSLLISITE